MPIRKIERLRGISGKYHEEIYHDVKPFPPTNVDEIYAQLQKIIQQADANELLKVLSGDFLIDSYSYWHNNGFHTRDYYGNRAQPVIEFLFINHPEKFLNIFHQVKDNAELYNAFQKAVSKSDLRVLEQEWEDKTIQLVNANLKELDDHGKKLFKEKANKDATIVTELSTKLRTILTSTTSEIKSDTPSNDKSNTPLLTNSPDLKAKIEFAATLHSKDQHMNNHRKFWKVVAGNILLGILGGVVFYGLAVWCKKGKPYFFADTDRQNKVSKLHGVLDPQKYLCKK